jgi:hypothetical protein
VAKYVSFYIPRTERGFLELDVLSYVQDVISMSDDEVYIEMRFAEEVKTSADLMFTGQIYLYTDNTLSSDEKEYIRSISQPIGKKVTIRNQVYLQERLKGDKPRAFISHDARDKEAIAQPIAVELSTLGCPVWFDEFSIRVGDSLRESIEKGLKKCEKCIFVLTPQFLKNEKWAKREFDSIFTRELIEKRRVILPVWHSVTPDNVYQYSPILADRAAISWGEGVEKVARKLLSSINAV